MGYMCIVCICMEAGCLAKRNLAKEDDMVREDAFSRCRMPIHDRRRSRGDSASLKRPFADSLIESCHYTACQCRMRKEDMPSSLSLSNVGNTFMPTTTTTMMMMAMGVGKSVIKASQLAYEER